MLESLRLKIQGRKTARDLLISNLEQILNLSDETTYQIDGNRSVTNNSKREARKLIEKMSTKDLENFNNFLEKINSNLMDGVDTDTAKALIEIYKEYSKLPPHEKNLVEDLLNNNEDPQAINKAMKSKNRIIILMGMADTKNIELNAFFPDGEKKDAKYLERYSKFLANVASSYGIDFLDSKEAMQAADIYARDQIKVGEKEYASDKLLSILVDTKEAEGFKYKKGKEFMRDFISMMGEAEQIKKERARKDLDQLNVRVLKFFQELQTNLKDNYKILPKYQQTSFYESYPLAYRTILSAVTCMYPGKLRWSLLSRQFFSQVEI